MCTCLPSSYAAFRGRVEKALWVQKLNCKTCQPPIATDALAYPPTHTDPTTHRRTNLHTRDVLQQYCSTYSRTCVRTCRVYPCAVLGFPFFYDSPPSGEANDGSPGEPLDAARSSRWSSEPVLSRSPQRAAMLGGRGATARPREAKWSWGVAAVFWACCKRKYFRRSKLLRRHRRIL